MTCYKDKTFCSETLCDNIECIRYLHDWDIEMADEKGLPLAMAFLHTDSCGFIPVQTIENK